jgi:hypothetical protein
VTSVIVLVKDGGIRVLFIKLAAVLAGVFSRIQLLSQILIHTQLLIEIFKGKKPRIFKANICPSKVKCTFSSHTI